MMGWLEKIFNGLIVILSYYAGFKEGDRNSSTQKSIADNAKRVLNEDEAITDRYNKYRDQLRKKGSTDKDTK